METPESDFETIAQDYPVVFHQIVNNLGVENLFALRSTNSLLGTLATAELHSRIVFANVETEQRLIEFLDMKWTHSSPYNGLVLSVSFRGLGEDSLSNLVKKFGTGFRALKIRDREEGGEDEISGVNGIQQLLALPPRPLRHLSIEVSALNFYGIKFGSINPPPNLVSMSLLVYGVHRIASTAEFNVFIENQTSITNLTLRIREDWGLSREILQILPSVLSRVPSLDANLQINLDPEDLTSLVDIIVLRVGFLKGLDLTLSPQGGDMREFNLLTRVVSYLIYLNRTLLTHLRLNFVGRADQLVDNYRARLFEGHSVFPALESISLVGDPIPQRTFAQGFLGINNFPSLRVIKIGSFHPNESTFGQNTYPGVRELDLEKVMRSGWNYGDLHLLFPNLTALSVRDGGNWTPFMTYLLTQMTGLEDLVVGDGSRAHMMCWTVYTGEPRQNYRKFRAGIEKILRGEDADLEGLRTHFPFPPRISESPSWTNLKALQTLRLKLTGVEDLLSITYLTLTERIPRLRLTLSLGTATVDQKLKELSKGILSQYHTDAEIW